jgi:hypothetical protein
VFVEVVLGNPGGIVTETLGVSDLLGCEAIAFGGWGGVEKAREEGEAVEVRGRGHRGIVGLDFRQGQPVARRAPFRRRAGVGAGGFVHGVACGVGRGSHGISPGPSGNSVDTITEFPYNHP